MAAELLARTRATARHLRSIPPSEVSDYRPLVDTVQVALRRIEQSLVETLAAIPNLRAASVEADAQRILFAELTRLSKWFTTLHQLIIYLPASSVKPETRAVVSQAFGQHYSDLRPTLILGSLFNALEFDFLGLLRARLPDLDEVVLADEKNIVLQLPLCDRDAPLAWAVLAHEMGHAVDFQMGISAETLNQLGPAGSSSPVLQSWAQEICADLIAAAALGSAPILSILSLEYCLYPNLAVHRPSDTHPATLWRLFVVREFLGSSAAGGRPTNLLAEIDNYTKAWDYSLARAEPDPEKQKKYRTEQEFIFDKVIVPLAERLSTRVLAEIGPCSDLPDESSLIRCLSRLDRRLPIAAQGKDREELREAIATFRAKQFGSREMEVAAFKALLPLFNEQPLGPTQILAACHAQRAKIMGQLERKVAKGASVADIDIFEAGMEALDETISASVTTSIVHVSHRERHAQREKE